MIDLLKERIRRLYAGLRAEVNLEPFIMPSATVQKRCNTCDSHGYNLCPIHPDRTYQFAEENNCPDWTEKRKS